MYDIDGENCVTKHQVKSVLNILVSYLKSRNERTLLSSACKTQNFNKDSLSGVPDLFDRNKILSGGDLSHHQVPHCIRVFFYFV